MNRWKRTICIIVAIVLVVTSASSLCTPVKAVDLQAQTDTAARIATLEELREPNSDTYLLSDGSYECVVYAEDKYYEDENGKLVEIDNTIVATNDVKSNYAFTNVANQFGVYFGNEENPGVKIENNEGTITFSPVVQVLEQTLDKGSGELNSSKLTSIGIDLTEKNKLTYYNVIPNVDIVYEVENYGIKEFIVLKDPSAAHTFSFVFACENHVPEKNNDGTIVFADKHGNIDFALGNLFAFDKVGVYSEDVSYDIQTVDDQYIISVSVSDAYANNPDREYPIIIDPSVMVTGGTNTYDAYVSSKYPDTNYYLNTYLRTGYDADYNIRRSYVKFDLPSYFEKVNADQITSSFISIRKYSGATPSVRAYRVTSPWSSSTITWNNKPGYTTTNASTISTLYSNDWYRLNVTQIIQSWVSRSYSNYGFVLKDTNESNSNQWTTFYSSDAASPNKPELHINYNEHKYWDYGYVSSTIDIYPYNYNDLWQTALDQSRANWNNTSAPVYFYTSTSSNNRIYAAQYDYTALGMTYVMEHSGSTMTQFNIELNSRTIAKEANSSYVSNYIQSVLVHEFGHVVWLDDNPVTPNSSIMKYSRDRNTMTCPSAYDVANVEAKY